MGLWEPSSVDAVTHPGWLAGGTRIPWPEVLSRLSETRNYGVTSVRHDGLPHARPVWGVCTSDALVVSPGGGYWTKRNLRGRPGVTVHPEQAEGLVVVVEGKAVPLERGPRGEAVLGAYNEKYGESYEFDESSQDFGMADVRPRRVYAWETGGDAFRGTRFEFK